MDQEYRVLTVCTGNICRSPAAAAWLKALSDTSITVSSAGIRAVVGSGVQPYMANLMRQAGLPVDGFAARQLTPGLIKEADLVLAMTGEHRRWVVDRVPAAIRRTFTLVELARLAQLADADADARAAQVAVPDGAVKSSAQRLAGIVAAVPSVRGRMHLGRGSGASIDVPDPYGRDEDVYNVAFALIRDAVKDLVGR